MTVERLLTSVDLREAGASTLSFDARHEAVLADGRRVLLLEDRGWTQSVAFYFVEGEPSIEKHGIPARPSPWESVTKERIEENARSVVGPDEAYGDYTQAEMHRGHWTTLAGILETEGVEIEPADLAALPHDVELSDRLLARLGEPRP